MRVLAKINTDSPTGKHIVSELEKHCKVVKLNYPIPTSSEGDPDKTYSLDEFKDKL